MRKNIIYTGVILAALCLNIHSSAAQERSYAGAITIKPIRLEQKGDILYVDVDFILHDVKVKSANGVDFIPRLVAPGQTKNLPKVSLKGREEYLAYERMLSLMSKKEKANYETPYLVEKDYKRKSDVIEYRYMLPYEGWMANAHLDVQRDECGCGEVALMGVEQIMDKVTLETPLLPYIVTPHMAYVQPTAEEIKRREVQAEAFLDFVVNKTNIRPDYMNNPRELAKIRTMIDELKNDPSIKVNRLDIIGYASPEGTLANNKRLSEGRAMALRDYLASHYEFPRDIYHIVFGGENWDGLVAALDAVDMKYKDEVLNMISSVGVEDGLETKLMNLRGGAPYRYMLKEIFPSLRVAICKVGFSVKNFDVEEAKEVIKKRPQNLSLNEMFLVANTYPKGSQEFIDVFETAVRMFPEDEIANLNAAAAALSRNDLVSAERYLNRVDSTGHKAEYSNVAGVFALLKGNYEQAEKHLSLAAEDGLKEAKQNLEELVKKRDNEHEIEKREKQINE
ncbi:DUF3868 domain-containing protein [Bacteroides sp. OttesenSCG-928-M17]|nr:DUF3868 domain-containing protein [Bacteroides sp. OttesenSCG-928-M17]MDL2291759.1 DUF3868 domain-containing protein [Bacteroides sp. OttesenSCG-928-F21]